MTEESLSFKSSIYRCLLFSVKWKKKNVALQACSPQCILKSPEEGVGSSLVKFHSILELPEDRNQGEAFRTAETEVSRFHHLDVGGRI